MKVKPFGILPSMFMIMLSVGLINHVLVVPLLLDAAKRDAWICVFFGLVIILPWTIYPLFGVLKKMNGTPLDHWLPMFLPRFVAWMIIRIFLLLQFYIAIETLIMTTSWTATTYLPHTPSIVVGILFISLCIFASISGLRTVAYMSCILLPLVVLMGDFVMSANMPHKDYAYLLPMFENGSAPVIQGVFYMLTSSCELCGFLFLQHHIKGEFKRWHFVVLILFLSLLALGPVMGAIAEFGPVEADKMRYPAFSQWRLVSIGKYFEHVDFFAIFQWMSGAIIRLAISIHILSEFWLLRGLKRKWISPLLLGTIILVISAIGILNMIHVRSILFYAFQYVGVVMMTLTVIIWMLSFIFKVQRRQSTDE